LCGWGEGFGVAAVEGGDAGEAEGLGGHKDHGSAFGVAVGGGLARLDEGGGIVEMAREFGEGDEAEEVDMASEVCARNLGAEGGFVGAGADEVEGGA